MKLLIIGGTRFLGRALVEAALDAGHRVTLFNRGQTNPDLFPQVEKLRGDRDGGLEPLRGRQWDAVVDACGYVPRVVRASAKLLADQVDHYIFISTLSVYRDPGLVGAGENAPLATLEDETTEEIDGETYGPLKALCEQAVDEVMGAARAMHVRSGLIVGPHDPTDRFTYWPHRVSRGGEVLAPGSPEDPVKFIDVRDLAAWIVKAAGERRSGPFNVQGPEKPLSFGRVLDACRRVSGSDAVFTWVDDEFLLAHDVAPFTEMPLWLPPPLSNLYLVDVSRAFAAGLRCRPLGDTVRDTLAWARRHRPPDWEWRAGLAPDREARLLQL
jgi:2'-hydroxyisoflavone reductase